MPYNVPVLEELGKMGFLVTVIHDTINKLSPFLPPEIDRVTFLKKEDYNRNELVKLAILLSPCVVYISDRTNPDYNYTGILLRKKFKIPVISGCDSQWQGGKQWFNVLTSWFRHKRFFSHMLVAGMRQFEYAKKLGFSNDEILWPMNSADIQKFIHNNISIENFKNPKNFLYVGRFAKEKGIEILLKAWANVPEKNGATLTLIGDGPMKEKLNYPKDVIVKNFMSQGDLIKYANISACFILPSIFEPWALVIHEFAASGLPLIVTSACGATPHFVINKYNGYVIKPNSVDELSSAIDNIIKMSSDALYEYAQRSRELSYGISAKMVAHAITSIVN